MVDLSVRYKKLLGDLLPVGKAWDNVKLNTLLDAMAVEFTRVHGRAADLLAEMYPGATDELLADWESLLGIPDECTPENQTDDERRVQILQKLATTGGISAEYYVFIAKQLGFDISIETARPFRVGVSRVGDALTNRRGDSRFRVGDAVGKGLDQFGWQFYYIVTIPVTELIRFRTGGDSRVGDPLVLYSNALLECTLKKLKPAHAGIYFRFDTGS